MGEIIDFRTGMDMHPLVIEERIRTIEMCRRIMREHRITERKRNDILDEVDARLFADDQPPFPGFFID